MGNLPSPAVDQNEQSSSLKISLDLKRPMLDQLKQLSNWSLQQIRQIYIPFRKRKGSPILSRSQFLRFIHLSRITSFFIFDKMRQTSILNVFEIIAILTLTSYAHVNHKIQFLFNLFDLESNRVLNFKELILLFNSIMRGYAVLTAQKLPQHVNLQKYAQALFSRADLNNDQNLQIGEILSWFQSNIQATNLFARFQPKILGKQSYHVFNSFPAYSEHQVQTLITRLNKIYYNQALTDQDYKILTPIKKLKEENTLLSQSAFFSIEKRSFIQFSNIPSTINGRKTTHSWNTKLKASNSLKGDSSDFFMPKIGRKTQDDKQNINQSKYKQKEIPEKKPKLVKKSFNNIIIIKGKTITKKQVFDLREYFDRMSNGKKAILIQDFLQSFNQQKYNHMKSVAASLFNFLDRHQKGKVTFTQLMLKLYPALSAVHLKMISLWNDEYNSNFNLDKKIKSNKQQQQHKKRILPKSCIPRFQDIYFLFDRNRKGFITIEDMKRVLGDVSTDKEIGQTFQDCDKDKDGRLSFQEFAHVILPPDLQIQGLQ